MSYTYHFQYNNQQLINLNAPINSLGYGVVGRNVLKAMAKDENIDVSLFLIGQSDQILPEDQEERDIIVEAINKSIVPKGTAPCIKIWHENQMATRIGKGPMIGYPFFEITKFDNIRIANLLCCNGLVASSKWAKNVILDNIPLGNEDRIRVISPGVDTSIYHPRFSEARDETFNVFNCGKWEYRKGHDYLLGIFKQAFPTEKDVRLHMMCDNPFPNAAKTVREFTAYYSSDDRVELIGRVPRSKDVADIMSRMDCGFFPSRAEGWNLELLEMMAMGKTVIATNYSAHTEFCNDKNCLLIDVKNKEKAEDGVWFDGKLGEWASLEGTEEQAVEHLRGTYEKWKTNPVSILNEQGMKTAAEFSWQKCASDLAQYAYDLETQGGRA